MKGSETIDAYIAGFPEDVQAILQKVRATILKAAPGAEEAIRYAIPTFTLNGNLVHFAAFKNHIGFYPAPSAIAKFRKELSAYAGAKGSVRFPLDEPIPYALIRDIVKFRVGESTGKGATVSDEKILTRHPQGKSGRSIDKPKYDKVAKAIRSALRGGELTHTDLMTRVKETLDGKFDGNIAWYAETVKLDLEAREAIERTPSRPQRYRLR